ncbi:MAG: Ig-like domain-containing protein, partial [Winogradskyella sp.]|uniref:Ig-like domain-containing protein n=1 Tax=Winogradskyella sp. TaxID=1883156 RepID=UPI0038586F99
MKNKYYCISVVNLTKAVVIALFVVLPNLLSAQQAPSIRTGITFQWVEPTQPTDADPATIESITMNGEVYNNFVVPSSYEMTRLGHSGHSNNRIRIGNNNGGGNSNSPTWNQRALDALQSKDLNHFFESNNNGRNICGDSLATTTTDAQKQTIFYSPAIPSNQGGIFAATERYGNNCYYIQMFGIPVGGGSEQLLGATFVRPGAALWGYNFAAPVGNSDYWQSGRVVQPGQQSIGIALFYLNDIAPTGSRITKIEFTGASDDHGDGKFFILQKYAVDDSQVNCIDQAHSGDLDVTNNAPDGSVYTLVSGPTPAGTSFRLNSDGTYTYDPLPGFTGEVTFDYSVCLPAPNQLVCDEATVTLNFVDLPPNPGVEISCDASSGNFFIDVISPLGSEYEYRLNGGNFQSSPTFSQPEGSYNLTVRNVFSECETIYTNNPIVLSNIEINETIIDVLCKSENTGAIDITVSGGALPYTYSWDNSATSQDLTDLFAGDYIVTVTDANGCSEQRSYTVNQPSDELSVSLDWMKNVDCNGNTSGDFQVTASGGTSPYNYSLDGGTTTQSGTYFGNLTADDYTVTVIDANDCTTTIDIEVTEPDTLVITVDSITNVSCPGETTGDIDITITGGTPSYLYSWSNGATTEDLTDVTAGTYTITVEDSNGCVETTNVTINTNDNENPQISVPATITIEGCSTSDITSAVAVFPYSTSQSSDVKTTFANNTNYNALDDVNIQSITYIDAVTTTNDCETIVLRIFTATDDCNNTSTTSQTITVEDTIAPQFSGLQPSISVECGNLPDTNSITTTDACSTVTVTSDDLQFSGGCAGVIQRTYTATDACGNSRQFVQFLNLTDTTDPSFNESLPNDITVTSNNIPTAVTLTASDNCTSNINTVFSETVIGDSCDAAYTIERTWEAVDGCGNAIEHTQNITVNHTVLSVTVNSTTDVNCFGQATGAIDINVTGGTPPYSYSWSNSAITQDLININTGNYGVTVEDANGCSIYKGFFIDQPSSALSAVINSVNATSIQGCTDGSATVVASGGTEPYDYLWSASTNNQTTATAINLPVGTHSVTVTDANNCVIANQSIEITCTDDCDTAITTGTVTDVLCFGNNTGEASASASSAINTSATFTFTWSNGQVDAGVTSSTISNVIAGDYTVSVTLDGSVCDPAVQTITITQPSADLSATLNNVNATSIQGCIDGSSTALVSGGTTPYNFEWSASAGNQTTATATNLPVGIHSVVITDANGCKTVESVEITCTDDCDTAITTGTVVDVLCFGEATGSASASASSAINTTATFTFTWSNGQVDAGVTSSTIADVAAGDYTVSVTLDGSVCDPALQIITIAQPTNPLSVVINRVNATSIQGCTDGTATAVASGGTAPYTYLWSASASGQTTATATNLPVGTHSVTVTDANNCVIANQTIDITCTDDCDTAITTGTVVDVLCFGEATGSASASASSAINTTATFTFTWSNGQVDAGVTSSTIADVAAGDYTVSVTLDGSVCDPALQTITIAQPTNPLSVVINRVNATSIQGCTDGTATAVASGGNAPYTYLWSASASGQTTATATNLPVGTHSVTVTDANNCVIANQTIDITCTDDCDTAITTGTVVDVLCFGEATGSASASASSAINTTATFTFTWSNGQVDAGVTSSTIADVAAGDYTVSVTLDGSVCDPVTRLITITEPSESLSATISSQTDIICAGFGDFTISAMGGTAPYSYSIDSGSTYQNSSSFNDLSDGSYTVNILDANGCEFSITTNILINCTYAISDINNTFINMSVTGNVLTNDEDFEGDNQTVTANTNPANGTVVMNPDGSYTYTPNPNFIGEDTFEYTICDDGNPQACDTAAVYIEVLPESGPENEA